MHRACARVVCVSACVRACGVCAMHVRDPQVAAEKTGIKLQIYFKQQVREKNAINGTLESRFLSYFSQDYFVCVLNRWGSGEWLLTQ